MKTTSALLAAAGLSLALGGCGGTRNRGLESVHQPIVERQDYLLDLQTYGGALASGERARLQGWFDAMRLGYGDRVSVDNPADAAPRAAAEVGGVVAGYGLIVADGAPATVSPAAPGSVRVVVTRARASVPGCPDWSRGASTDFEAHTSSNYGCATNSNLAAMIANPTDLVRGQAGSASADPAVSTKAIDIYRKAAPTGSGGLKVEKAGGK